MKYLPLLLFCLLGSAGYASMELEVKQRLDRCYELSSVEPLTTFIEELDARAIDRVSYWKAYTQFHVSVYYAYQEEPMEKQAQKACAQSLRTLENILEPDAETLALWSYVMGFHLQWLSGPKLWIQARKARSLARDALKSDPKNPRCLFVNGNIEVRAPDYLGNRSEGIDLLVKALEQFNQATVAMTMPQWGKVKTYQALILALIDEGRVGKAVEYLDKALSQYPQDDELLHLDGLVKKLSGSEIMVE